MGVTCASAFATMCQCNPRVNQSYDQKQNVLEVSHVEVKDVIESVLFNIMPDDDSSSDDDDYEVEKPPPIDPLNGGFVP